LVVAVAAVVALLAVPGCGAGPAKGTSAPPPGPTTGAASPSGGGTTPPGPSASPSSSAVVVEFSVDGAGPYQIGAHLSDLQTTPGLSDVTAGGQGCPQDTSARGTGVWKDVYLSFHQDGELYLAVNKSLSIPTPSGAWLGTPLAQLKTIYAKVQTQQLAVGARKAFLVITLSGRGILFDLSPQGTVASMAAGDATYLATTYQQSTNFC
jgi:hypothetical protein